MVGATNPEWVKFKQDAEKAGIYVDIVDFQDYTSENPALDSGELDLNEFQHLLYLANYNVSNKKDLQPSAAPPSTRSACTPPRSRTSRT